MPKIGSIKTVEQDAFGVPDAEYETACTTAALFYCSRQAFQQSAGQEDEASIDAASFTTFCQNTPEVTSWIHYCGLVHEVDVPTPMFTDYDAMRVLVREQQVRSGERATKPEDI